MTPYELAYEYVLNTQRNVFLTGKAGTGKTTLLRSLRRDCPKQMMVVAPTGVAAINAEGVTIHSLFQLPPHLLLPTEAERKKLFEEMQMKRAKQRLLANLELLVIDEISMVRADLLDAIDVILRRCKRKPHTSFGGTQLLFIGDLYQLSPVVKENEWDILRQYYQGPYFFQALIFKEIQPIYIELDHVFRQTDQDFVDLLNQVRENKLTTETRNLLNTRYQPNWKPQKHEDFHIVLATHNQKVDAFNLTELQKLKSKTYTFHAEIIGNFPETLYPTEEKLTLKKGARVMFIRSDSSPDKKYYNGKLGIIQDISDDHIIVECNDQNQHELIQVHTEQWENIRYTSNENSDEIKTEVIGTFKHIPLRLAWAVTIHKAQGLTFDHVVIDAQDAFAAGQVYVALSRCRTLNGIILRTPIPNYAFYNAQEVIQFTNSQKPKEWIEAQLNHAQREYLISTLSNLYDFHDTIQKIDALRRLANSSTAFNRNEANDYLLSIDKKLQEWQKTADKFQKQIQNILSPPEPNLPYLQQRLQAAYTYFAPLLQDLQDTLKKPKVYADDKELAKEFETHIEEIYVDLNRQTFVMSKISENPTAQYYFDTRNEYNIPNIHIPAQTEQQIKEKQTSKHPDLLKQLYKLRNKTAEDYGWLQHPYRVVTTQALIDISNTLPTTQKALLAISGIGKAKYDLIGTDVLAIVKKYIRRYEKSLHLDKTDTPTDNTNQTSNSTNPNIHTAITTNPNSLTTTSHNTQTTTKKNATTTKKETKNASTQVAQQAIDILTLFHGGHKTIEDLARTSNLSIQKTACLLIDLLDNGLLRYANLTSSDQDYLDAIRHN